MYANTLETLLAKQDIADVMARYARGIDRADATLLHSCYFDDAVEEHGNTYAGPARPYIDAAIGRVQKSGVTLAHYICNMHIELDGDHAHVESYIFTFARFGSALEPLDTMTGGRIIDRFEKRAGEWRIAYRKMAFDWNRDMPSSQGWCGGVFNPDDPRMIMGAKSPHDLSYSRF